MHPSFYKQILLVFLTSIAFTLVFSFLFIHYLYSELYLASIESSIIYQGQRTAAHYHYGELSDEIIQKIQWYNIVSEYEIIVVEQLENLTTYFPYQVNYQNLIHEHDQSLLEQGKYVVKKGYVQELNREIVGAVFPIKGEQGLLGFIFIYVPLAAIQDVFGNSIPVLLAVGTLFFLVLFFIVQRVWKSMFRPLDNLHRLAIEVARGNYGHQVPVEREDEIGQLTQAFNHMSQSLAEQEERKKEFISNMVHELRTPLTYIRGYAEVLKQKMATSPEEAEHYLSTIARESERLNQLIADLIDLNHLQEELYAIDRQPFPVAQVLLDAVDLFAIHMAEKKLHLKLDVDEDLIIAGDAQRIHQVFYNTIDNAVKYSDEHGTISISLQKVGHHIQYQIHNRGLGIAREDLERVGERFFRTDEARSRATGGSGLGMSIVREIVRLHDGTLTIDSDGERGTTVTIRFPHLDMEGAEPDWGTRE